MLGMGAANQLKVPQAAQFLLQGNFSAAGQWAASNNVGTVMQAGAPLLVVGLIRKFTGPIPIVKFGKTSIDVI